MLPCQDLTLYYPLLRPGLQPQEFEQQEFGNQLLRIGEGLDIVDDIIRWPTANIIKNNSIRSLMDAVFPGPSNPNVLPSAAFLADLILLVMRNDTVTELNKTLLISVPGQLYIFKSADKIVEDGDADFIQRNISTQSMCPIFRLTS